MTRLVCAVVAAFVLWGLMFSPLTAPHVNFWALMSAAAVILVCVSLRSSAAWRRMRFSAADAASGALIAAALWVAFWLGDALSALMLPFARPEVQAIYAIREGLPPWALTLLLMLLIGPAEELFWRGYVQDTLSRRFSPNTGFAIATLLYTAVHLPSCNFMLVMASLVAGGAWGLAYRLFPRRLAAIVLSHALWDAAVFIWFPIRG